MKTANATTLSALKGSSALTFAPMFATGPLARLVPHVAFEKDDGTGGGGSGGDDDKSDDKNKDDKTKGGAGGGDDDKSKKKPTDEEAELLKEVMDKKTKIKGLEGTVTDLTTKLKAWEGLDPAEVRALVQAKKDAEAKELEAKGEWDKLKTQMAAAHEADVKAKNDRIAELEGLLGQKDATIGDLTVGSAFSGSKFIGEKLLLTPAKARVVYGQNFEVENGNVVAYDKPRGTSGRVKLVDAKGEPVDFETAIAKLVEADPDRESMLRSQTKQGAGSKGGDPSKGAPAGGEGEKLVGTARIEAALAKRK